MDYATLLAVARGDQPADLLLKNLQLINLHTGEIYPSEIAIYQGQIVGIGAGYSAATTLDLSGQYVAPGLIDAHVHIESSLCTPPEFAKAVLPRGITSVVTDPHEIANVLGLVGIEYMLQAAQASPLQMYVMASSCVPATHMETSGAALDADDLAQLLTHPQVLGLAEMMNYPGLVFGDPGVLAKVERFRHLVLDGHCPGLTDKALNAYRAAGIMSDHECTTAQEAHEKLQKGFVLFIREATNARNLRDLLPVVTPENHHRICFCTDDRQPADLLDDGSIDYMIRVAIQHGIDPIMALRMGSLNTAEYFRLYDRGAIAPGYRADLMVFPDLQAPLASLVIQGGRLLARDLALVDDHQAAQLPNPPQTMNIAWEQVSFDIPVPDGANIRVMGSVDGQLVTEHRILPAKIENGLAVSDTSRDLLKMLVIERHHASGKVGQGFIQGFGLQRGAIAGTVAHDHHNLVAIGVDNLSLQTATRAVAEMGGGLVAVEGEQILAALPLPIAGLMSDQPIASVRQAIDDLIGAAHRLGSPMHDPFMAMSFMALEVIPKLKLTDLGLVDVETFQPTTLVV